MIHLLFYNYHYYYYHGSFLSEPVHLLEAAH